MSGFSFITARKRGKSRVAKSTFKSVVRTLKTVPPPALVPIPIKEEEKKVGKPPSIAPLPQAEAGSIPFIVLPIYNECKSYGKRNDELCERIKLEMGMDLTHKLAGVTNDDIKSLYNTFIRRYMRFLKFRNAVTTQFTNDAHFNIEDCSFVINEQFRNFMNFDISIASIMRRFELFIETDMEAIENIIEKDGKSRLDKLYRLLYNQILINTGPYYEYIIELLKIHDKIRKDLIKTIGRAQQELKKNVEIMKKIKKGDTISQEDRNMIVYHLLRLNPNKDVKFNLKITDGDLKQIKSIIDFYEKYCQDNINELFEASLEIQDVDDTIRLLQAQLGQFEELYASEIASIKNTHDKDIVKQFLTETRKYYREASRSASRSLGSKEQRVPALVDISQVPIGAPKIDPLPTLPPPASSQVMKSSEAIDTLMQKFFG